MEERLLQFGGELRRLEESEKALGLEADRIAKTSIRDHEISKNSIARLLGVLQSHVTALIGKVREGRRESRGRSRCWSGTRRWSWSRWGHLKRVIARYLEREQTRTDHLRRIYDHWVPCWRAARPTPAIFSKRTTGYSTTPRGCSMIPLASPNKCCVLRGGLPRFI